MPTIRERNGKFNAQVRVRRDGIIVHQESATFATKKQASLWGLSLEKKIATDGYGSRIVSKLTVDHLMTEHEAAMERMGRPTEAIAHRFRRLKMESDASFAHLPVSSVTSEHVVKWAEEFSEGRAPATVLNHLMALRAAYRAAKVGYGIEADVRIVADAINHLKRMGVAADSQQRSRRLLPGEMDRLIAAYKTKQWTTIPMEKIMQLLVYFPRRREEVMTMKWDDYDVAAGTIMLHDTKDPTGKRDELVPVPPKAKALLATFKRTDERIAPYNPETVSNSFRWAVTKAGITDLHLHDLRHEGISQLFEAGLSIPEVSTISGHKSWATLKRYTHIKPQTVLDKLNANQ